MDTLITLPLFSEDYDLLKSWQLAKWCQKHGADAWAISAMAVGRAEAGLHERFEAAMLSYRLPAAQRRSLTAYKNEDFVRDTDLWRLNSASLSALQEFLTDGLFTYPSYKDAWFEDPIFYRNGELMLGIVSHEKEGVVRVTEQERVSLEAEGFAFRPSGAYVGY